jgi:hypothetical protein
MKRSLHAFLFLFLCGFSAHAQLTSCTQTLRLARATYDQGRLHEIPGLFEKCLHDGGFSQEERVEAYKLLCLTYIYLEEPQKADEAMLSLLRTDPYFKINKEIDPAEFIALYRTFRTHPIYRIGPTLGVNATTPQAKFANTIASGEGETSLKYNYKVAFQFGASADLPLNLLMKGEDRLLTLHGDLLYQLKNFELQQSVDRGNQLINELTVNERQSWIALPVSLQYQFLQKKYHPYVSLGVSGDYLLSSELTLNRVRENTTSVEEKKFDVDRNKFNVSGIAGIGTKFPVGQGLIVFEIQFIYGFVDVNTEANVYANQIPSFDYTYPDTVYKLRSLSVSGAYIFNKFNPKKLNRKK